MLHFLPLRFVPLVSQKMLHSKLSSLMLLALCWAVMFGAIAIGARIPVLCDAGHFYEPMFQWNSEQTQAGALPLWNANENLGTPVAADATSSVFYPLKQIFLIKFIPFHTLNGIYTSIHILIAALGIFFCALKLKCRQSGATVAALSFAFGGSVLFQTSNIVFLVGAAWLPWAAMAVWQIHRTRQWRWAWVLALVLSMMVLGGDPQMAYNVGLMSGLLWLLANTYRVSRTWKIRKWRACLAFEWKPICVLTAAATIAVGISAIQILPTHQWASTSKRQSFETPRNVYEIPKYLSRKDASWEEVESGLFGELQSGTHQNRLYHFSQPPWTLVELAWPNVTGKMTPYHSRWATSTPSLGRVWQSSLYLGLIPLMFAICCLSICGRDRRKTWLTWLVIISILGSFGWYGFGWMLKMACATTVGSSPSIENQVGGVYWMLVTYFPGYSDFRYPAKLFIISNFAISLLAGIGFSQLHKQRIRKKLRLTGITIAALSISALTCVLTNQDALTQMFAAQSADNYFGPFQVAQSVSNIQSGLVHALVISIVTVALLAAFVKTRQTYLKHAVIAGMVLLTAIEICVANYSVVPTVALQPQHHAVGRQLNAITVHKTDSTKIQPDSMRLYRVATDGHPAWLRSSSSQRVEEIYQWENDVLDCKNGLKLGVPVIGVANSIPQQDIEMFFAIAAEYSVRQKQSIHINQALLDALSVRWLLVPKHISVDQNNRLRVTTTFSDQSPVQLLENTTASPRSKIIHQFKILPPLTDTSTNSCRRRTKTVLFDSNGKPRDFAVEAVVEAEIEQSALSPSSTNRSAQPSVSKIVDRTHTSLTLKATLAQPGLLVVNDYFEQNWKCQIRRLSAEGNPISPWSDHKIVRTNRIMRGVMLPAGNFEVVMFYQPNRLHIGSWISLLSCMVFMIGCVWQMIFFWQRKT